MKKLILAGLVVTPLAAYPAASWLMGQQAERLLGEQYAQLEGNVYLKLHARDTQRGVFNTVETATFEWLPSIGKPLAQALCESSAKAEGAPACSNPTEPLRFTVRTTIQHGPLPGLSTLALATAHSELVLAEPRHPVLASLYGDKTPLTVDTVFRFGGDGHQSMKSPAVDFTADDQTRLQWGEFNLEGDFTRGAKSVRFTGGLPFVKALSPEGAPLLDMSDMRMEGTQTRLFDDDPYLYAGPVKLTLARLDIPRKGEDDQNVLIEGLAFRGNVIQKEAFLDLEGGYAVDVFRLGEERFGPVRLDAAFRHMEARSLSRFYRDYTRLVQDGDLREALAGGAKPDLALFKPLLEPARVLLENSPEFSIDRLDITLPKGTLQGNAVVRLPNAKVGNLADAAANPLVLMGLASALEAEVRMSVPEALAVEWAGEDQAAMIPVLTQEGYIQNAGGVLSSRLSYARGEITVNGKKLDPALMGTVRGGE
ncbi:MAG: YdgA family protein [Pseudomonadota bacterium]